MERWRTISGFEGRYEVSDLGRVRSLKRTDSRGIVHQECIKKCQTGPDRRPGIVLEKPPKTGKRFRVSRLVATAFLGEIPKGCLVDHINHDTTDNRLCNLRIATSSQNCINKKKQCGIYWHATGKKWTAVITKNYKTTHLGMFANRKDAVDARRCAEAEMFGDFAPRREVSHAL